jgi:hypothetical protein
MNMNFKLELNAKTLKAMLPKLRKAQPYLYGLALVGIFAFTGYTLNQAVNVTAASKQSAVAPLPKITFYKNVIDSLQNRNVVNGDVPLNLGTSDPFK